MSEKLEVVRGSGNVFRDLGHESPDLGQLRAILAAEIIKALDREGLSVRAAHARTGVAAADFSRIRNADLGRFTVDRLVSIVNRLGAHVEVVVRVGRERPHAPGRRRPALRKSHERRAPGTGVSTAQITGTPAPRVARARTTSPSRRSAKRR